MRQETIHKFESDRRRQGLVEFDDFNEWAACRAYPLSWKVAWISVGVFVAMTALEFLQESGRAGMVESLPLRVGALVCLVLMTFALKGHFSFQGRDIQASVLGCLAQWILIAMDTLVLGRPQLIPFIVLFFLFGALVISPALRLPVYVASGLGCDACIVLMSIISTQPITDLVVTMSIIMPAQGFLGYAVATQRRYARENWRLTRENHIQATIDALSQVLNRRAWYDRSRQVLGVTPRDPGKGQQAAFIMLDIDYFKRINDTWGHECGDLVIRRVADAMMEETRDGDLVGRLGGEEFGVLLAGADASHARQVAERIRHHVENLDIIYRETSIKVTISLGLCNAGATCPDVDTLVRSGDLCLYRAKNEGRNRVVEAE